MINPISFGSTYKIQNVYGSKTKTQDAQKLSKACRDEHIPTKDCYINIPSKKISYSEIIVPNELDSSIENYCIIKGINFEKSNNGHLLDDKSIKSRVVTPDYRDKNTTIAMLNAEAFDRLCESQTLGNIKQCEEEYEQAAKPEVNYMLKSGKDIMATSLSITPLSEDEDVEELPKDSFIIDFEQQSFGPDQCMYFAMRDLGMKEIPVCVNEQTLEAGQKLGILKK